MAIITYSQESVLSAYQQWLMQQGAEACLERITRAQDPPDCTIMPNAIWAQAGSLIRYSVLTTLSTVNVFFAGQFLTATKSPVNLNETVIGTTADGIDRVTRTATPGCFQSMVASVGSQVVAGTEVYVLAELGQTNNGEFLPYAILLSGYVRTNEPIDSRPGTGTKNVPGGGTGGACCIEALGDWFWDPDTENPVTIPCPVGANIRPVYLQYNFTTSGVAGNRRQYVAFGTSSKTTLEMYSLIDQPASVSYGYTYQAGGSNLDDTTNNNYIREIPDSLWHDADMVITIQRTNPKAGDTWSSAVLTYTTKGP